MIIISLIIVTIIDIYYHKYSCYFQCSSSIIRVGDCAPRLKKQEKSKNKEKSESPPRKYAALFPPSNESAAATSQAQPRATGSSLGAVKRPSGTSTGRLPLVDRSRWPNALDGDACRSLSAGRWAARGAGPWRLLREIVMLTTTMVSIHTYICICTQKGLYMYYILYILIKISVRFTYRHVWYTHLHT